MADLAGEAGGLRIGAANVVLFEFGVGEGRGGDGTQRQPHVAFGAGGHHPHPGLGLFSGRERRVRPDALGDLLKSREQVLDDSFRVVGNFGAFAGSDVVILNNVEHDSLGRPEQNTRDHVGVLGIQNAARISRRLAGVARLGSDEAGDARRLGDQAVAPPHKLRECRARL